MFIYQSLQKADCLYLKNMDYNKPYVKVILNEVQDITNYIRKSYTYS